MLLKILYDIHLHLLDTDYLKAKPLFWTAFTWFVMLCFSVGSVLWAAQAEVHSSWTGVSCQKNTWTDPWSGAKEDGSEREQDLSMGCRKGEGPWVQTRGHRVSGAQPLNGEKGRKKDLTGKASQWGAKLPNSGCQAWQQAVMFKCRLYHERPNPAQHCPAATDAHSYESLLWAMSEGRYQKR